MNISQNHSEIFQRTKNYIGAGAGDNTISSEIPEIGAAANPELTSSTIARRGFVLCFSHSSGKNTPVSH